MNYENLQKKREKFFLLEQKKNVFETKLCNFMALLLFPMHNSKTKTPSPYFLEVY